MKHVVSVSLGAASRDTDQVIELLGHQVHIERRGVNGDIAKAKVLLQELDGKVDALGLGGVVLFIQAGGRRYQFRDAVRMARVVNETPTVCGAGLKASLERVVVEQLEPLLGWADRNVLMVSGVENFGMAEALDAHGADVSYGDLAFFLGLPLPIRGLKTLARVTRVIAPVATKLPIAWLYPLGEKQESTKADWRSRYFKQAEVICGDFHLIRRYLPDDVKGKIILTQTTTEADVALLKARGLKTLITTTPRYQGRSLATNLLEAALVAIAGHPLSDQTYRELIQEAGLTPAVLDLNA